MSVLNALSASIYTTLTGGTALTSLLSGTASVYNTKAPDTATLPYVVFSLQAGQPMNINPSDLRDEVMWVRGYTETSMGNAGSIDLAISNLLHGKTLTVTGYTNYSTMREQEVVLVESQPDGVDLYTAGAMYRIELDN